MDPISAGASVLAFVAMALKSTEALYEIVSRFKNASQQTTSLACAVSDLASVLAQLHSCKALAEPNADLTHVAKLINNCHNDVRRYQSQLKSIQPDPSESNVRRVWKKIRGHLGEKGSQQIWKEINNHCTMLGVQLSLLQSNTSHFCKDKIVELNDTFSERAAHDWRQFDLLQQQSESLSRVNTNTESLESTVHTITERMERISEMSQMQSADIAALLEALNTQVAGLPAKLGAAGTSTFGTSDHGTKTTGYARSPTKDTSLTDSIQRLCQLATENGVTKTSVDAEEIIADLATLLKMMAPLYGGFESTESYSRRMKVPNGGDEINAREMKRLRCLLSASHSVDVNKPLPRSSLFKSARMLHKHKRKEIRIGIGKMDITIGEKWLASPDTSNIRATYQQPPKEIHTRIRTFFEHSDSHLSAVLVAHLRESQISTGFASLNPVISIGKTLPDDSPIFTIVREGNVKQLKGMLTRREATLRDRDSWGTPLLHYAMEQPEMCKFLIQNGADIDELALNPNDFGHRYAHSSTALAIIQWIDNEQDPELVLRKVSCMNLLACAGADPTLGFSEGASDFYRTASASAGSSIEVAQRVLLLVRPFIDFQTPRCDGVESLLPLDENNATAYHPLRLALLLLDGADIHARNETGETCLHVCIRRAFHVSWDEFESLLLLVQSGADVRSVNFRGFSISDDAYTYRDDWDGVRELGGYRGDLWDAVLFKRGYNIQELRKGYPRTPRYTDKYTRERFELLWRGREVFCPYFDDPDAWYANLDIPTAGDI